MSATRRLYHTARRAYLSWVRPTLTQVREETYPYSARNFWDHWWYNADADDEHSIERDGAAALDSAIHYRAVETSILLACHRHGIGTDGTVLDIGSGAGHWLDFWTDRGATDVRGCDISEHAVTALTKQYQGDPDVTVFQADVGKEIPLTDDCVDVVSAVGVMFHLTRDERFQVALEELARVLDVDGVAFATGAAGWLSRDRQFQDRSDSQPTECFKRLRSRREWRRRADAAGLKIVETITTPDWVDVDSPENRLVVLRPRV